MQLRKLLLPGLLSVTLLSGCSLFNSEEDVVKMSPLPTVENQFTPTTAWSTSVGSGIGNFYSNLHPALADNVVYAADRAGLVKALNADDGKEIWSVSLAEKDGWFSNPAAVPRVFCRHGRDDGGVYRARAFVLCDRLLGAHVRYPRRGGYPPRPLHSRAGAGRQLF